MRNYIIISSIVAVMASSSILFSQNPTPKWLTCPRCQSNEDHEAELAKVEGRTFNPRDLTGIWGRNGVQLNRNAPPMTPEGLKRREATKATQMPAGGYIGKDPMLKCDPLGMVRWLTYNYGFEFAHLPDRVIQFIQWGQTYRTIWTDGRALPENPDPRWMGYSVGHWEGDTLVVESHGFDDRPWLDQVRGDGPMIAGWPLSDQMRTTERYRRTSFTNLEYSLTIVDPKTYTAPWVTQANISLFPGTELTEYYCAPSDSEEYNTEILGVGAGATQP
jgi:hypothetical protein